MTQEDGVAVRRLKERLLYFLAEGQREVGEALARLDQLHQQGMSEVTPAGEGDLAPAQLPSDAASAAGAYLAVSAQMHDGGAAEATTVPASGEHQDLDPDHYRAATRQAIDLHRASIGELTERIVEIQRSLSTL